MSELYFVETRILLPGDAANRLSHLAQIYQVSEGEIVEKGVDILSSITNLIGQHPDGSPALFGKPVQPIYDNPQTHSQTENSSRGHHQNHRNIAGFGPKPAKKRAGKSDKFVETPLDKITYDIIGHAMHVHRERGPGYRENTYHRDLEVRFDNHAVSYQSEPWIEVYDSDQSEILIGYYIPDFIVEEVVALEIKALPFLDNSHLAQLIGYLAATDCQVGLLINFGTRSLKPRRVFPPKKITEHRVNRQWLFVPDSLKKENE